MSSAIGTCVASEIVAVKECTECNDILIKINKTASRIDDIMITIDETFQKIDTHVDISDVIVSNHQNITFHFEMLGRLISEGLSMEKEIENISKLAETSYNNSQRDGKAKQDYITTLENGIKSLVNEKAHELTAIGHYVHFGGGGAVIIANAVNRASSRWIYGRQELGELGKRAQKFYKGVSISVSIAATGLCAASIAEASANEAKRLAAFSETHDVLSDLEKNLNNSSKELKDILEQIETETHTVVEGITEQYALIIAAGARDICSKKQSKECTRFEQNQQECNICLDDYYKISRNLKLFGEAILLTYNFLSQKKDELLLRRNAIENANEIVKEYAVDGLNPHTACKYLKRSYPNRCIYIC